VTGSSAIFWDIIPCSPFRVNWRFGGTSPTSSVSRNKPRKKPGILATCFRAGILLDLFDPEDGGDTVLQNVGWLSTNYTALHPRR
jgi:hypothetical protein